MGKKYSTKCPNLKYSIIMEGKITWYKIPGYC
jgi:hypothetical protein